MSSHQRWTFKVVKPCGNHSHRIDVCELTEFNIKVIFVVLKISPIDIEFTRFGKSKVNVYLSGGQTGVLRVC